MPEPGSDDDHVLALFQVGGLWGALAKLNYPALRWREPVHRSLRELAMTYFEFYFNLRREKTLRAYTGRWTCPVSGTRAGCGTKRTSGRSRKGFTA